MNRAFHFINTKAAYAYIQRYEHIYRVHWAKIILYYYYLLLLFIIILNHSLLFIHRWQHLCVKCQGRKNIQRLYSVKSH